VAPQEDLGAPASPSRMRSADLTVVGEALADDACTAKYLKSWSFPLIC
jgi:hypothetical protein